MHRSGRLAPHARNGDVNKSLSGTRRWQLNVIKFHYFGAAISSYDNYLHRLYRFI
jgi:hypothetical protein